MSSLPAFTPNGDTASLSATTASGRVALARKSGGQILVQNAGPSIAYLDWGDVTVAATVTDTPIPPGAMILLTINDQFTHVAAITSASTAALTFTPGSGELQAALGGPSNGGGGGGANANQVQGTGASDATRVGNPVAIGGTVNTTTPTAATSGQAKDLWLTANGGLVVAAVTTTAVDTFPNAGLRGLPTPSSGNGAPLLVSSTVYDRVGAQWLRQSGDVNGIWISSFTPVHITTSTTTVVKGTPGVLHSVIVNTKGTIASTITIYNNTAASGTVVAIIDSLNLSGDFTFDITMSVGITVVTTGTAAPDITVTYR